MNKRRILAFLLSVAMLVALLPSVAFADDASDQNVITYTFNRATVGSSEDISVELVDEAV